MTVSIPRTDADLTAEWFSAVLERRIDAVTIKPIGVGVGLIGNLYRVDFDGDANGPSAVIAKLSAPTDEGRFVATVLNMYGREVGFYNELSPRTPIEHPECFYAVHDAETQDCVLLLEDVSARGRSYDQLAGCSAEEARPLIRTLARLHAHYWDDPTLKSSPWLLQLCDDPYPGAIGFAYDMSWPRVKEVFPDLVDERVQAFGDAYSGRLPALLAKLCDGPQVLSHADWRVDNLFISDDGDVIALDWQLVDRSCGPRDLSYLMTQSVNVTGPGDYQAAFDMYVSDLAELGVAVDRDWAWEIFRYGTSMAFTYPVIGTGALTVDHPRHLQLTRAMLERCIAGLEALDAFDLPL